MVRSSSLMVSPNSSPVRSSNRLDLTRVFHQNSSTWIPLSFSSSFLGEGFVFPQHWGRTSGPFWWNWAVIFLFMGLPISTLRTEDALKWVLWFQWIPVIKSENLCKTIAPCALLFPGEGKSSVNKEKMLPSWNFDAFFPQPKFSLHCHFETESARTFLGEVHTG